tara:strand:- start:417 stop:824 length:408 start_codon:yes stop_codon:yes gene_type:complete
MKFRKKKHEAGTYFCLADAHGIESFMEYEKYEKTNFPFTARAEANRRRHAITFVIDLNQSEIEKIYECLEKSYFIEAFNVIKRAYISMSKIGNPQEMGMIKFPEGLEDDYLQSFMILPDHNLDPHYTIDQELTRN